MCRHIHRENALSENTEEVEFLIKATIRSIEICKELGIKNTVAHCGFAANIDKDEFFKRNSRFYEKLFPAMEACNVNVLVENSMITQFYYLNSGKDMCEFLKYVGHPQLHACWDTGHGNILGTQYEHISELGDDLYAIHYNDNHGNLDEHILPFMGILNHDEVINALIDINYKGYFTLECSSSLLQNDNWLFKRKQYIKSERLINPQLFMQRRIEALLYDTAEYILSAYDIFEK